MSISSSMKVTVMPAGHGECVLVQCEGFNLMVDSGPSSRSIHRRVHSALVDALKGRPIDLAIVTHHDDDHIGGLERVLASGSLSVQSLLFNSPKLIFEYRALHSGEEEAASARQALQVARRLTPSNKKVITAGNSLRFFGGRIALTVLSPLGQDILNYGARMLAPFGTEELAGTRGRDTPICGRIEELLAMDDDDNAADTSETNLLSLAFILTFEDRSILFLGDSWPSRVTKSIAALRSGETRIPLNLVFVSHHGSRKNNTAELYRHIDTERYVISADGKQNPDVETFGRILRAAAPKMPGFYFSEDSEQLEKIFSKSDIDVYFPAGKPLTFDL